MPILIAILLAVGGAVWFWVRANPRDALGVADDVLTTARNAPRRIAFRRQTKAHPVEGIDDARLALAALATAYLQLDDLPTRDGVAAQHDLLRILWHLSEDEADEMQALAAWLVAQCNDPAAAIPRLGRRLYKIDETPGASWTQLERLFAAASDGNPSSRQVDAVGDLKLALHRR